MISLSKRQWPVLEMFVNLDGDKYMSIEAAQKLDQRPFRSMLVQGWIVYARGRGFHITREGRAAWEEYNSKPIWRKDASRPLTQYFDPTAYGLHPVTKVRGAA